MKITLPNGGTAELSKTWTNQVHYSLNFHGKTKESLQVVACVMWLDREGFFDQEMGKFNPDPDITAFLKEIQLWQASL